MFIHLGREVLFSFLLIALWALEFQLCISTQLSSSSNPHKAVLGIHPSEMLSEGQNADEGLVLSHPSGLPGMLVMGCAPNNMPQTTASSIGIPDVLRSVTIFVLSVQVQGSPMELMRVLQQHSSPELQLVRA